MHIPYQYSIEYCIAHLKPQTQASACVLIPVQQLASIHCWTHECLLTHASGHLVLCIHLIFIHWSPTTAVIQVGPSIVIAIAANKQDLHKQQVISSTESQSYAATIRALHFGTSAKTGNGLQDIFQAIADTVVARMPASGASVCPSSLPAAYPPLSSSQQHWGSNDVTHA